ncbi:hypothetical protein [Sphingomonas sp. 3-13AW]|uniref:hypothetical protein n=1 Tax=Sphingomonas sp. 3-13AW TaxID=3050450 RepID=UPI003BB7B2D6
MRLQRCCIDAPVVEQRCDQQLRRYLDLRQATLYLGKGTVPFRADVIVTGIDCDHFGPLLRAGDIVEADVEIADDRYRLVDRHRRQHAEDRAYASQQAQDAEQAQADEAHTLAVDLIWRAQRA